MPDELIGVISAGAQALAQSLPCDVASDLGPVMLVVSDWPGRIRDGDIDTLDLVPEPHAVRDSRNRSLRACTSRCVMNWR